jgi:hypothetical protein
MQVIRWFSFIRYHSFVVIHSFSFIRCHSFVFSASTTMICIIYTRILFRSTILIVVHDL